MKPLLSLYKQILGSAKTFPSKNRIRIISEIREEFRRNSVETDQQKIDTAVGIARKGLMQLQMYSGLPKNTNNWSVTLDENPMPQTEK